MQELCDLKVHIDGQEGFILHQKVLCSFSGRMKRMVKQEKKRSQVEGSGLKLVEFPGGPHGFELVSRFCYNNGEIVMSPSNVCLLHCAAVFLEMAEEISSCNLLRQTEAFIEEGLLCWTWNDVLTALKSCAQCFGIADSTGLLDKLISSLLAKISAELQLMASMAAAPWLSSSSSSSSSPDTTGFRHSLSGKTPERMKPCGGSEWWFDELTILAPGIIVKIMKALGAYGMNNKNLILTRFLLHYLKTVAQRPSSNNSDRYGGLADTAVHGVVLMGRAAFSCRALFSVLRLVSGLGLSKECRQKLERLMGLMLDQATLDDLLISGNEDGIVYDVNLVLRLVRIFVSSEVDHEGLGASLQRMKKVGRLIDKYLGEISPDQSLKVSKFLAVAESLPDSARDCFDGVYRALDIYLESHPSMSMEDRTMLCRCLNYEKLTLETCKDLAKNRRTPPAVAVQALALQQSKLYIRTPSKYKLDHGSASPKWPAYIAAATDAKRASPVSLDEKEVLKLSLHRMQSRVMELEKVCRDMKGQMSKMAKSKSTNTSRGMPRLC